VVDGDEGRSKNLARAATVSCSAYAHGDWQKACSRNRRFRNRIHDDVLHSLPAAHSGRASAPGSGNLLL